VRLGAFIGAVSLITSAWGTTAHQKILVNIHTRWRQNAAHLQNGKSLIFMRFCMRNHPQELEERWFPGSNPLRARTDHADTACYRGGFALVRE